MSAGIDVLAARARCRAAGERQRGDKRCRARQAGGNRAQKTCGAVTC
jgi:hypothetical protein